ncbi:MAG: serine/threonine-protein kinase [Oculatellaceae cyanobacterium bins.114]|nr:serine/threonine-protein kinase [Oculatellaceae cyanobacterium bins.114]
MRLLLGDRYRGFSLLGGGHSSRTFLALDISQLLDPRRIVKAFTQADQQEDAVETLRREVAQLARISQHPQLPDLLAYFERDQQQFLVQEFVEGRNLLQQLADEGSWEEAQILQLLREVLPLLQFLHDHQMIHRDVKPANLIRRADGRLVLVDYGAAKVVTQSTLGKTGTVMGSAEYAAPEQLLGKATFASDLYGLGVTCIHLLTGLRPFELYNSATGTWFWRSAAGMVSDAEQFSLEGNRLGKVIDKLLQSSLNQRYASAAQVLKDLDMVSALISPSVSAAQAMAQFRPVPTQTWAEVCLLTVAPEPAIAGITALLFDSQSEVLISSDSNGAVKTWAVEEQKHLETLISGQGTGQSSSSAGAIATLALSPTEGTSSAFRAIATGGWDDGVRVWNRQTGQLLHTLLGHQADVTCVAMHPNGQHLLSGSRDRTVHLWDWQTGKSLFCFKGHKAGVEAIAISPNGYFLASGDAQGAVKIWHLGTQELLRTLPQHTAAIGAITFHPDHETVISSGWDMTVQVRNLHTGAVHHQLKGHLLPVTSISISPDGNTIATGSHDTTIKLWDWNQGTLITTLTGHTAAVEAVVFISDEAIASGSQDGTIKVWKHCKK